LQYSGGIKIDSWITDPGTIAKSKKHYAHFDCRTDMEKVAALVTNPDWVSHHGFYPFIHYKKDCSKYSKKGMKEKKRDIRYASHTDRCILQYYSHNLNELYNDKLKEYQIEDVPVAYRTNLGMNNIHLAKIAFDFIKENPDSFVIIGDFTGFFDNLDHDYLKKQWCQLIGMTQLPSDQYNIYKNITKYSTWELDDLLDLNNLPKTHTGKKKLDAKQTVLTKEQYKDNRSHIHKNTNPFGIPQGSPISALLANVYMLDADREINAVVSSLSGKYMRYSDDFIIILPAGESDVRASINSILQIIHNIPRVELEPRKTQIYKTKLPEVNNVGSEFFEDADESKNAISFLGFTFDGEKTYLRSKTVSKYYYRMYRKASEVAKDPQHRGKKKLYRKYSEKGAEEAHHNRKSQNEISGKKKGNFFTYVHHAEVIFNDSEIRRPVKNHMAKIRKALNKQK
jgi:hypothetical protein